MKMSKSSGLTAAMVLVSGVVALSGCQVDCYTEACLAGDAMSAPRDGGTSEGGTRDGGTTVTPIPIAEAGTGEASAPDASSQDSTTRPTEDAGMVPVTDAGAMPTDAADTMVAAETGVMPVVDAAVVADAMVATDAGVMPAADAAVSDVACVRVEVTCGLGACARTVRGCEGAVPACVVGTPSPEVCGNAIDEDCVGGAQMCPVMPVCVPSAEVCDGIDNDCDSMIDEGLGSVTCGRGRCANTVPRCVAGVPQTCVAGTPVGEVCSNGQDEDCDGTPDNGCPAACVPTGVEVCGNALDENCDGIVATCPMTTPVCTPSAEVCDGRDNDCDGLTDEELGTTTCGTGACARTVNRCSGGLAAICAAGTPVAEICGNAIDEDCDGNVNNGCSGTVPVGSNQNLRFTLDMAWFNVAGNCTNCGACATGLIASVFDNLGVRHDSAPGAAFEELVPDAWRGVAAIGVRCGSDIGSARWLQWPAALVGRPVNEGGISSMTYGGNEYAAGRARICTYGGVNRPLFPRDSNFENRCP